MSRLIFENLWKSFGHTNVLQGVDFELQEGESVVLLGPSGCGKSVLLRCLLGLLSWEEGDIIMSGQKLSQETHLQRSHRLKDIGVVFQDSALFDSMTILENVAFGLKHAQKRGCDESQKLSQQALSDVGLNSEVESLYPSQISGGMQRRVALARAIVLRPKLLFFDEPTAGLDPIFGKRISRLIRSSIDKLGATALTITHDTVSAHVIGDRFVLLNEGKIIWSGTNEELLACSDPFVKEWA